jgi:hypothetical protein
MIVAGEPTAYRKQSTAPNTNVEVTIEPTSFLRALEKLNLHVAFWHESDIPRGLLFGRFRGQSGHQSAISDLSRFYENTP